MQLSRTLIYWVFLVSVCFLASSCADFFENYNYTPPGLDSMSTAPTQSTGTGANY